MNSLIRTITNTVLRASIYKGMRGQGKVATFALAGVAAIVTIITQR